MSGNATTSGTGNATTTGTTTTTTSKARDRDSRKYKIPTLDADGSDFGSWKHRVRRALRVQNLWDIVNGKETRPAAGDPLLDDWIVRDEEATAQIEFTIANAPLQTILDATSSKEAWDRLCERYEGKGKKCLVRPIDKVFHTAFTDTEPLEAQINDLLTNIRQINELKQTFDDEITAIAVINALPASLDTLQTILSNLTSFVPRDIKTQIVEDEQRRIGRSGSDATAFFAKARTDARRSKQQAKTAKVDQSDKPKTDRSKQHCTHCDIDGHDVADCRKLKREKAKAGDSANKDKPEKASAKVAVAESESDEDSDTPSSKQVVCLLMASDIALSDRKLSSSWILDSGASRSMSSNREWFSHFSSLSSPIPIALGDNSTIYGTGVGHVVVGVKVNDSWQRAILEDVLYVPELHGNLLSVAQLTRRGNAVHFTNKGCEIYLSDGTLLCKGLFHSNLYVLPIRAKPSVAARVAITELSSFPSEGNEASATAVALTARGTSKADAEIWHRRLAHLDYDAVIRMVKKGMVRGMEITGGIHPDTCEPCIKGKHMRSEISKHTETRSETILGRIFSDVCGKLPTRSHQGYEYFAIFVDDKSRKVHVAGLKRKSDVAQNLKDFVARAENETGQSVKILRSDGSGEYIGSALTEYLKGKGIRQELTTADTPQHNGVAERMNKTLLDKVRSMLLDADLPELYWYDALVHATHLHNVSPTRTLEDMTPEEAWSGNKPDVSDLRVFGSKAFVHIPDSQRTKLGAKSLLCTHLGLAQNRKAYRLVHRPTRRFFESRDVIFDEGKQIYQRVVLAQYRTPDPAPPSSTSTPEPAPTQLAATLTPFLRLKLTQIPLQSKMPPQPPPHSRPPCDRSARLVPPCAMMTNATRLVLTAHASVRTSMLASQRPTALATRARTRMPWRALTLPSGNSPARTRNAPLNKWASMKSCPDPPTAKSLAVAGFSA